MEQGQSQEAKDDELKQVILELNKMRQEREMQWVQSISEYLMSSVKEQFVDPMDNLTKLVETKTKEINHSILINTQKIDCLHTCQSSRAGTSTSQNTRPLLDVSGVLQLLSNQNEILTEQRNLGMEQSKIIMTLTQDVANLQAQLNASMAILFQLRDEIKDMKEKKMKLVQTEIPAKPYT